MSVNSDGTSVVLTLTGKKRIKGDFDGAYGLGCRGTRTPDHVGARPVAAVSPKIKYS